jgi:hypothetical protein
MVALVVLQVVVMAAMLSPEVVVEEAEEDLPLDVLVVMVVLVVAVAV